MDKKLFFCGKIGTYWYNFTESLAYLVLHRPTPESCSFMRIKYGYEKLQYVNFCTRKDNTKDKKPVFVYIHGGGFISGITDMRNTYVQNWAQRGFFTASISYSYAPDKVYPAQLQEIFTALDLIYEQKKVYNLDFDKLVLAGESAGGYYIMMLTAFAKDKSLFEKFNIKFNHKDEFDVKTFVTHCGCFDLKNLIDPFKSQSKFPDIKMMVCSFLGMNLFEARSFLDTEEGQLSYPHVTADFPPAFIVWADRDYLRYEAFDLIDRYRELKIPYEEYEASGIIGNHAWSIATVVEKGRQCFMKTYEFVIKQINE